MASVKHTLALPRDLKWGVSPDVSVTTTVEGAVGGLAVSLTDLVAGKPVIIMLDAAPSSTAALPSRVSTAANGLHLWLQADGVSVGGEYLVRHAGDFTREHAGNAFHWVDQDPAPTRNYQLYAATGPTGLSYTLQSVRLVAFQKLY